MKNVCFEISERYCFEFDAIGCDGDHVHLFIGTEPKYSPSKVMQIIESITARQIFKQCSEIKKQVCGGELLDDGDHIGTIGDGTNSEILKNYVQKLGELRRKEAY